MESGRDRVHQSFAVLLGIFRGWEAIVFLVASFSFLQFIDGARWEPDPTENIWPGGRLRDYRIKSSAISVRSLASHRGTNQIE